MHPSRLRKDLPGATEPRPLPPGTHREFGDLLSPEELEDFEDLEDYYAMLEEDDHEDHENDNGDPPSETAGQQTVR